MSTSITPVVPITAVKVLHNVPLDNSYTDTLDFSGVSAQIAYFTGKAKYAWNNMTPIRLQNAIKVPKNSDDLFDCNYIMFQNSNFGQKWFYAFITKIEYINVNLSLIHYELDVWQTWQFDITIKPSFVIREHSNDDTIGSNLVPENVELGDYRFGAYSGPGFLVSYTINVASTVDNSGTGVNGDMYGKVYSGLRFNYFATAEQANTFIASIVSAGKSDAIVGISMVPTEFKPQDSEVGKTIPHYTVSKPKNYSNIDGYIPKNNKLFTYPYNFLMVTNHQGTVANYHYEYFAQDQCTFDYYGDATLNPQAVLIPQDYKQSTTSATPPYDGNPNEKIVIDGFPQCAFSTDTFKAWLAQNASSIAISTLSSAMSAGIGVASGSPVAASMGVIGVGNVIAKVSDASVQPPQAHGSTGSTAMITNGLKQFSFCPVFIRAEFAKIIDDYFSMYGYATHRLKVPNITGRPSWNYVQTLDAKIVGSVPFGDISKIKQMFNRGVTFWHGDYVGDYTRNNGV